MKLAIPKRRRLRPGDKINNFTVIKLTSRKDSSGSLLWEVLCDCGNTDYANHSHLLGTKKSCGCLRVQVSKESCLKRVKDKSLIGEKFGKLLVCERLNRTGNGYRWRAECECGNSRIATSSVMRSLADCGCGYVEIKKQRKEKLDRLFTEEIINLLGKKPDAEIAKLLKIKLSQVRKKRKLLNIEPFNPKPKIDYTEEMISELGKMSDVEFARKYKLKCVSTVGKKRLQLNIPAFRKMT